MQIGNYAVQVLWGEQILSPRSWRENPFFSHTRGAFFIGPIAFFKVKM